MERTYTVRLIRPAFHVATIEVDAYSRDAAIEKAKDHAMDLETDAWSPAINDGLSYSSHVDSVIENQDIYECSHRPHRDLEAFANGAPDSKHLILSIDLRSGEASFLPQPWFLRLPGLQQADLCATWSEQLAFLAENDGFEELDEQSRHKRMPARNVVEFPERWHEDDGYISEKRRQD